MCPSREAEPWRRLDCWGPALLTGLGLGLANYIMDAVMEWLGTRGSQTILNDMGSGILGFAAVYLYLTTSRARYNLESAKERMTLIGELNRRIREALGTVAASALSDDRAVRLQGIDEATDRIDGILTNVLNTAKHSDAPTRLRRCGANAIPGNGAGKGERKQ